MVNEEYLNNQFTDGQFFYMFSHTIQNMSALKQCVISQALKTARLESLAYFTTNWFHDRTLLQRPFIGKPPGDVLRILVFREHFILILFNYLWSIIMVVSIFWHKYLLVFFATLLFWCSALFYHIRSWLRHFETVLFFACSLSSAVWA